MGGGKKERKEKEREKSICLLAHSVLEVWQPEAANNLKT